MLDCKIFTYLVSLRADTRYLVPEMLFLSAHLVSRRAETTEMGLPSSPPGFPISPNTLLASLENNKIYIKVQLFFRFFAKGLDLDDMILDFPPLL